MHVELSEKCALHVFSRHGCFCPRVLILEDLWCIRMHCAKSSKAFLPLQSRGLKKPSYVRQKLRVLAAYRRKNKPARTRCSVRAKVELTLCCVVWGLFCSGFLHSLGGGREP